jgi:hypothetical protein
VTDRQKNIRPELLTEEVKGISPFVSWLGALSFCPPGTQQSDEMNDQKLKRRVTPAEREALKVFGQVKIEKPVSEHEKAQKAFHKNRERLKALRLAREAAEKAKGTWRPRFFLRSLRSRSTASQRWRSKQRACVKQARSATQPWLRDDFTSTHSNGAPLWDGKAPLRARMGYEGEIATFGDVSKDAQPSDGMLMVYLVELDDNDTAENSEPTSATQQRWEAMVRDSCVQPNLSEPRERKSPARNAGLGTG